MCLINKRYFQYDSWWYDGPLGVRGGCSFWNCTPVSHLIPNGMKYIYEKTKLPASAHNKYWGIITITIEFITRFSKLYISRPGSKICYTKWRKL